MTARPTPDQIAAAPGDGFSCLERLADAGYVIIHSDDIPERAEPMGDPPVLDMPEDYSYEANYWAAWWSATGWNACRARILSGRASTEEER